MTTRTVRAVSTLAAVAALLVPMGCASAPAVAPVADAQAAPAPPPAPPDIPAQIEGMKRLEFMVGRWEGAGYVIKQGGVRTDFTQSEVVQYKLDGTLIAVDGDGRDAADPTLSVHSAFAVATYDPAADTFRWEAFNDGGRLETELVVSENRWQWMFQPVAELPDLVTRFTADFTPTQWREIGEISLDGGATWNLNLEMNLTRVE